nr:uncharacterized protein LOC124815369 [Hydra vulgaris]
MSPYKLILDGVVRKNDFLVGKKKVIIPETKMIKYNCDDLVENPITTNTNVIFNNMKTDECAIYFLKNGLSKYVTVMNFASKINCGGGYIINSRGQEEDLCKVMPALYYSLKEYVKYPFPGDSVLITPKIGILRKNNKNYDMLDTQLDVGVVSASAPNLQHEYFDEERVKRTLKNMYCAVKKYIPDTDTLILGAWGCGAYRNDPSRMAKIMNDINLKYGGHFKTIVFSVPDPNSENASEFKKHITLFTTSETEKVTQLVNYKGSKIKKCWHDFIKI